MFRIHSALGSYCPTTNLGDSPYSAPPHGCPREVNFKLHSQQTPPMKSFIKEAFLGILQLSIGEATKSPTYESNCQPFQRLNKVTSTQCKTTQLFSPRKTTTNSILTNIDFLPWCTAKNGLSSGGTLHCELHELHIGSISFIFWYSNQCKFILTREKKSYSVAEKI